MNRLCSDGEVVQLQDVILKLNVCLAGCSLCNPAKEGPLLHERDLFSPFPQPLAKTIQGVVKDHHISRNFAESFAPMLPVAVCCRCMYWLQVGLAHVLN